MPFKVFLISLNSSSGNYVWQIQLQMQCKPAAGNRGPMFLQLYPSYVDAHEDIAIASNWEQIHVCLQQLFLSKCVWEWIIYLLHVTLTYPHKTPNMPFISIHRHMLVKISKCYRDFFWGRTSLYPLKILWASILPFLALFDPPYNLLLPIVFPDLACVTGTSSGSTTHNNESIEIYNISRSVCELHSYIA